MATVKRIYLDANGSSPVIPEAKEKLKLVMDLVGNPSSSHVHGQKLREVIDEARSHVAHALNAQPKEVLFTSGASESNRLFCDALVAWAQAQGQKLKVLISPFEHPSLYKPVFRAHEAGILDVVLMDVNDCGEIFLNDFIQNCDVVIATQAHNETGILIDTMSIFEQVRADALIMSDSSQAFSRADSFPHRLDVITFSAQKMGGFAGAGGMIIRNNGKKLSPPWSGGGQERGFRPGTESSLMIAALGEAARFSRRERDKNLGLSVLRDHFEEQLLAIAPIKVIGHGVPRLPNTSAICFKEEDADALRIGCDLAGLSVGFGAACSGLAPLGSFALKKLGLSPSQERSTIRFSFTPATTSEEITEVLHRLTTKVLRHLC